MGKLLLAIVLGGLAAGILDITYAALAWNLAENLSPETVLQGVAAGWIGRDAARVGGLETAGLGLGTHFMIALVMAAVFVFAAQGMKALTARPILWGLIYGVVLFVAMNYVVVPLSAAASGQFPTDLSEASARVQEAVVARPRHLWMLPGSILAHTLLVGVPIALIAKRFGD